MKRFVLALLVVATTLPTAAARADEADWLYDPGHVSEIGFTLSDEARASLAAEPDEYVPASFTLARDDGTTYGPLTVGLKLKGKTSFRTLAGKAAFKLKFGEFVKGQKFQGLKKLTLNNMVQDPTMLHELLAYEAFRTVGLAASRAGYAFVRVDGEPFGVYLNLETLDGVSLPRWYATTQHLYEGEAGYDLERGAAGLYELDEGDEDDRSDLEALIAAVDTWIGIDEAADLERLTRFWAVEKYIGHADGYAEHSQPNNYYLHSDAAGRFTMLPWGTDQTWSARMAYGDPGGRMFDACLSHRRCRAMYLEAVEEVRSTLGALDLAGLATDTAALLRPWQEADPRREHSLGEIEAGIEELQAFLAARPGDAVWSTGIGRPPAAPSAPWGSGDDAGAGEPMPGLPVTPLTQPEAAPPIVAPRQTPLRPRRAGRSRWARGRKLLRRSARGWRASAGPRSRPARRTSPRRPRRR
ncbi:MAG TPA: CotH kinase family protein [Solirubrobacteraceae bacterium]